MNAHSRHSTVQLVALVSCYHEGRLVRSAIESVAPHVDRVLVLEGPFGDAPPPGAPSQLDRLPPNVTVRYGKGWADDAAKRTAHKRWACEATSRERPLWGILIDGDEILMHGQWLRDWCERATPEDRMLSLRLQEWDGTVMRSFHFLQRLDLVDRYWQGAFELTFIDSSVTRSFPNFTECSDTLEPENLALDRSMITPPYRAPLQGEPHIFHRSFLRPTDRFAERASNAELDWQKRVTAEVGL